MTGDHRQVSAGGGPDELGAAVRALWDLTLQLRVECPWDRVQTAGTIAPHTVEETYEVVDAVAEAERAITDPDPEVRLHGLRGLEDELGDLLFQVVFLAMWCSEHEPSIDLGSVARAIHTKLVRRHPHVFGEADELNTADEVRGAWEKIKREREGKDKLFDGVPASMPSVGRARKLQLRAAQVGFDFERAEAALDKLDEEVAELREAIHAARAGDRMPAGEEFAADPSVYAETGDVLFAAINVARLARVDPETSLAATNRRFEQRVETAVDLAAAKDEDFASLNLEAQEVYYQQAKAALSLSSSDDAV